MADEDLSIPPDPVPPRPRPPSNGNTGQDLQKLELEALLRKHVEKELSQKLEVKWMAVRTGFAVSVFMGVFLLGALHQISLAGASSIHPATAVAAIVGPIVSITTVPVALFIGAFRKFDKKDLDPVADGAPTSTSILAKSVGFEG